MARHIRFFYSVIILALLLGCATKEDPPTPRSEATKKLIQVLENDCGYKPVVRWAGETLWVYVPGQESLYKVSAGEGSSGAVKKVFNLQFIDGSFQDHSFSFEYDIVPATKVSAGSGLGTGYSEAFHAKYQNVTNALSQSFFTVDKPPRFVVIVIADTQEGLIIKNTAYMLDLKKYYTSSLPPDEYSLRMKTDFLGDKKIINDSQGRQLSYDDINWPDFLISQIIRRIQFKFQNSDFPPQETPREEIVKTIAMVTMIYGFRDYTSVMLDDLRAQQQETLTRNQVEALQDKSLLGEEKTSEEGRIITFDFSQFLKNPGQEPLPPEKIEDPSLESQQPAEPAANTTP